jgi:hypothetical protein
MPDSDLQEIFNDDDLGLLEIKDTPIAITPDERLVTSFLEIVEFVDKTGHAPTPSTSNINEYRLYSRLLSLRKDPEKIEKVQDFDTHHLLEPIEEPKSVEDIIDDDDLGLLDDATDILTIKNVPTSIESADYIGRQKPCKDFDKFEHKFEKCHQDLEDGKRIMRPFAKEQQIAAHEFFVLKGVMVYVAKVGEKAQNRHGKTDARLRLIYENGTESDILLRSLARALYRDGRRITEHEDRLMAAFENIEADDEQSGYIYVLTSRSDNQEISSIENLYKIGFSTMPVEKRVANAAHDPTYLMAPVDIVQTYRCYNLNPQKFEHLLHRLFIKTKLDLHITDKLREKYIPDEWFVVPFPIIDQAVQLIINGEIVHYEYDAAKQDLVLKTLSD